MTYIHHSELNGRIARGESPKGGPLPESRRLELLDKDPFSMTTNERLKMLDKILAAAWEHPLDSDLTAEVLAITGDSGRSVSLAQISDAAEYVHSGKKPITSRVKAAYQELADRARHLDKF